MDFDFPIKLNDLATRLLAYEGRPSRILSTGQDAPVFRVCEKLRLALSQLTGVAGFRSLLSRALALASAEVPWLHAVHIRSDGSLEGVDALKAKPETEAISLGEVALVARLLGLLVTFIGPALTQRLLQDIWPRMEDLSFERKDGDENI